MQTFQDYQSKIEELQQELRSKTLTLMAQENIALSRVSIETGCSWATIKKFIVDEQIVSRETIDKIKTWIDIYEKNEDPAQTSI